MNTEGGHICVAPLDGYDPYGLCAQGAHDCSHLATCEPDNFSKVGYTCNCQSGYRGNGKKQSRTEDLIAFGGSPKGCQDLDECLSNMDDCGVYQVCYNVEGSFMCLGDPDPLGLLFWNGVTGGASPGLEFLS